MNRAHQAIPRSTGSTRARKMQRLRTLLARPSRKTRLASAYNLVSSCLQLPADLLRSTATITLKSPSPINLLIAVTLTQRARTFSQWNRSIVCSILSSLPSHFASHSLLIEFFLGAFDWFHLPIPIWIQVESIAGTVRLRCQMIQEFPYVRNVCRACACYPIDWADINCVT